MAKASMRVAYYLFLLTFCIDEGDGRWKKADREILQRDIKLYKEIAERVEYELQEYYDEYADNIHKEIDDNRKHYHSYKERQKSATEESEKARDVNEKQLVSSKPEIGNDIPINNSLATVLNKSTLVGDTVKTKNSVRTTGLRNEWPKFEDMLLAMGKKYDWRNDRWIKVKEKFKNKETDIGKRDNSVIFHEKHRFIYRSIKLNRGKNKRNVVIAVTAIR